MGSIKDKIKGLIYTYERAHKWQKDIPITHIKENGNLLEGKTALITGGSRGIGFAIAKKFISCGCKVIIAGTNSSKLNQKCEELGENCKYVVINVSEISSFEAKVNEASNLFGPIDILVCSHGIHTKRENFDFLNVTNEEYDLVMNVNLKGTYFLCQNVAKNMISNKIYGHILVISSQSALEPSWSPYRLSKSGVEGIVEGMAQRLINHSIIVNGLGPGPTATTMQDDLIDGSIYTPDNPVERYTMPEEVAEFAKMLVSDLGNTIIGQTLYMSGGRGIIDRR